MEKKKPGTYEYNKKYVQEYMRKQVVFKLRMTPEQKAHIDDAARAAGESINQYILNATQARMEKEREE